MILCPTAPPLTSHVGNVADGHIYFGAGFDPNAWRSAWISDRVIILIRSSIDAGAMVMTCPAFNGTRAGDVASLMAQAGGRDSHRSSSRVQIVALPRLGLQALAKRRVLFEAGPGSDDLLFSNLRLNRTLKEIQPLDLLARALLGLAGITEDRIGGLRFRLLLLMHTLRISRDFHEFLHSCG